MNKILLFIFFISNNIFAENIENIFKNYSESSQLNSALWGIYISYTDGTKIFSNNANKNLVPASILKIFTAVASLDILGPEYKFKTELYYSGEVKKGFLYGDLILKGGGDMTLGSENFNSSPVPFIEWENSLKKAGIKGIKGNIIVDDYLLNEIQPGSWDWEDIGNYYAAPFSALSFNDNLYKIFFRTGNKEGDRTEFLRFEPEIDLKIENNVITGPENSGDNAYIYSLPWSSKIIVKGYLPAKKSEFFIKGSIGDGAIYCGEQFKKALKKNNFDISGKVVREKIENYKSLKLLYIQYSPPVKEILKVVNKKSFNFYAEMLLRLLPYKENNTAGFEKGLIELKKILKKANINTDDIYLADASGLSRLNCVKTSDFIKILNFAASQNYFEYFYNSLAYPADPDSKGHIRKLGIDRNFSNDLRIKSGSLKNIRAYCGYLKTKKGKIISFASILNNYSINPILLDRIHEEIFSFLYENY